MKRDMELVRQIVKDLSEGKYIKNITFNSEDNKLYYYHLEIMRDAGLIYFKGSGYKGGFLLNDAPKLTWLGNDFLDSVSNNNVWEKTKDFIKTKGFEVANIPLDVLIDLAKIQMKQWLGIE